ncbi:MAG: glycoside hydrolase [Verrucomicrobiales bacterium]|nr:glycoside hydrolase [Verrucomicrobiales bacterium]
MTEDRLAIWSAITAVCLLVCALQATAEALFEGTDVFVGGQDDINTYRIPSLICTKNGTLLAFCEGQRDNNVDGSPTHLVLKRSLGNTSPMMAPQRRGRVSESRSRERNLTWQPMQILIRCKDKEAYMNPVPLIDRSDGTLYMLVHYCPGISS